MKSNRAIRMREKSMLLTKKREKHEMRKRRKSPDQPRQITKEGFYAPNILAMYKTKKVKP